MPFQLSKYNDEARRALSGAIVRLLPSSKRIQSNKVVFCNHYGAGYGCNPKYIAEELLQWSEAELDLVWLVRQSDASIPKQIRQVRYGTPAAAHELATARVWIDNYRTRRYIPKKPGQIYVQTWHGALGPKHIEADAIPCLSRAYIEGAKRDSEEIDVLFANNSLYERVLTTSFFYKGPVARCGMPRNAAFFQDNEAIKKRVRLSLGIQPGTMLCLVAPTFRDKNKVAFPPFAVQPVRRALEEKYGAPCSFAFRAHPNTGFASIPHTDFIDATDYPDVTELLIAADVLITDYSSIAEDYALTGKPGYLFIPDREEFEQQRGLYYPHSIRPFPVAFSEQDLIDLIQETSSAFFNQKRKEFFDYVGMDEDGLGAKVIASVLEDILISTD